LRAHISPRVISEGPPLVRNRGTNCSWLTRDMRWKGALPQKRGASQKKVGPNFSGLLFNMWAHWALCGTPPPISGSAGGQFFGHTICVLYGQQNCCYQRAVLVKKISAPLPSQTKGRGFIKRGAPPS